jgi:hypothetical protein
MVMIEIRRIVSPSRILGSLVLALGLSSYLIKSLDPRWPEWLRPFDATMVVGQYRLTGQRLAGYIIQARRHEPSSVTRPLGILMGSSGIKHAVDGRILDAGSSCRWLNLGAASASVEDCYRLTELLYSSRLKIDSVVLGLHPEMLARTDHFLEADTTLDPASARRRIIAEGWRGALNEIDRLFSVVKSHAFPHAVRTNYRVREAAETIRTSMLLRIGMGLESIYRPAPDPWAVAGTTTLRTNGRTAEQMDGDIAFTEQQFGFYRSEAYRPEGSKFRDLDRLFDLIRSKGSDLIVLIVPGRTNVRSRLPKEASESLATALERHPELSGRVLDLYTSIPDDRFWDAFHLNEQGRDEVSACLADFIRSVKRGARPEAREGSGAVGHP